MKTLRPYKPSDALNIKHLALDIDTRGLEDFEMWAFANYNYGPCYTFSVDGSICWVAGIRIVRQGLGHMWAVFTPRFRENLKACLRVLHDSIDTTEGNYNLKILRTLSSADFVGSQRVIQFLHFERRRYIKEINKYLYVRKLV